MVIIGVDGRIVLVNAQAERVFGYPRSELIGETVEKLIPERLHGRHVGHCQRRHVDHPPHSVWFLFNNSKQRLSRRIRRSCTLLPCAHGGCLEAKLLSEFRL